MQAPIIDAISVMTTASPKIYASHIGHYAILRLTKKETVSSTRLLLTIEYTHHVGLQSTHVINTPSLCKKVAYILTLYMISSIPWVPFLPGNKSGLVTGTGLMFETRFTAMIRSLLKITSKLSMQTVYPDNRP